MRWPVFAIVAYVALALQAAASDALAIPTAAGPVGVQFVLILAVFVGLSAPPTVVMLSWALLGFCLDASLTWDLVDQDGVTLIGPYTLAYMAGAYTVLEVRTVLLRYHPLTIASMVVVCGIAVSLVVVAIFSVRGWYEAVADWSATRELFKRSLSLLYTAAVALFAAIPLVKMAPLFGFSSGMGKGRRGASGRGK